MFRHHFFINCLALLFTAILARDPPIIKLPNQGSIIGKEVSKNRAQKIYGYLGIPYAQPPLDKYRFALPVTDPLPSWEGVQNATEFAPACLQTREDYKDSELPFLELISDLTLNNMNEDCLYLNVFVPTEKPPPQGFTTIVWFHPGNFTTGTPNIWNPRVLVYRHRLIFVTVAWRLNILGFFSTMDGEAAGNFGLWDQQAALKWIKNNIKLFGGNPENICLMGYGTGAMSIGLHMINPGSRGLFNKAIAMSGNVLSPSAVKYPPEDKQLLDKLADNFACIRNPTSVLMECLRNADAEQLVKQTSNIDWRPLIDVGLSNSTPPFLAELPKNYFERGDFYQVPFLTGYTNMENILEIGGINESDIPSNMTQEYVQQLLTDLISSDVPVINNSDSSCIYNTDHITDSVLFYYGPSGGIKDPKAVQKLIADFTTEKNYAASTYLMASYISKTQPTYVYRFDMKPTTPRAISKIPSWVGVPHLFDLIYVWGVPYWGLDNDWDIRDKRITDAIMAFWTQFAKTGDPTEDSIYPIKWENFTKESPGILLVDGTFNMSHPSTFNYKAFDFWNDYYPKVKDVATQCCSPTENGSNRVTSSDLYFFTIFFLYCLFKMRFQ